jgi:pimeloyl-ACP methyl ester carboxylesterase
MVGERGLYGKPFKIDFQNPNFQHFIHDFRIELWEFGNLAWLVVIGFQVVAAFSTGLPSAIDVAQIFVVSFLAVCWLFLNPASDDIAEAMYRAFQPMFSPPISKPKRPTLEQIRQFGYQQTSMWRGWKIHHTVIPNPRSQVPVIFVHGFGGSIGHWRQNMSELAKYHSVYAIDLLGFGASDKPTINYSIELWVQQLHEFWQAYVGKPVILVGNSIGSLTCLATAATHPEMVKGVAMISLPDTTSHADAVPAIARPLVRVLQNIFLSPLLLYPLFYVLRHPLVVRRWASLAYACKEAVTDELLEILTKPARERNSARAFCAILKAMTNPKFSPSVRSILGNLHTPSLLLWGKQDRMIPSSSAQQFLRYNPQLKLVELENAGHCAHDECPERVNSELVNWIQTQVL